MKAHSQKSNHFKRVKTAQFSLHTEPLHFSWWHYFFPPFFGALATIFFYFPSLHYSFQFDDLANITKYYDIRHQNFNSLFLKSSRWISYWLNTTYYKIAQFDPFIYRVGNLCFHITTGIIIFFVCLLAFGGLSKDNFFKRNTFYIACFTMFFFLLHPLQTQTVSYVIQGQLEGLAGLFTFLIVLLFLLYTRADTYLKKICITFLLYFTVFLACGTKEIVIVVPFLLVVVDWFFISQGNIKILKKHWWLHLLVFSIVFGMYLYFLKPAYFIKILGLQHETRNNVGNILTHNPADKIRPYSFCISQFKVILHYIAIFLWPFSMSVDYDWMLSRSFFSPDCLFPFIILCLLAFIIIKRLLKNPVDYISFCFLWFFIIILPRSSVIPSTELLADYKTYGASFGIFLLFSYMLCLLFQYLRKYQSPAQYPFIFLALLLTTSFVLGVITFQRNKVWSSAEKFWFNIIKNAPYKARAYNNYGVAVSEQERFKEAIEYFKKAITLDQTYPDPYNNLAVAYSSTDNLDLAIDVMERGIKIQPHYPEGYNNLATFLLQKKDYEKAETALRTAIKIRPHYGKAHFNLSRIYSLKGKKEESCTALKNASMNGDLDTEICLQTYGRMCIELGKYTEAIEAFEKAVHMYPRSTNSLYLLASAHFLNKDYDTAQKLYTILIKRGVNYPRSSLYLAEIYYIQHKYQDALNIYMSLPPEYQNPELYMRMALCYEKIGNYEEAQKLLEKAINSEKLTPPLQKKAEEILQNFKTIHK